jgi:hypothetical protein
MMNELPGWIKSVAWPDEFTFGDLISEPHDMMFESVSKEELQAVWQQRLNDATVMGNDPGAIQNFCDWLSGASNDLKLLAIVVKCADQGLLAVPVNRRCMLLDMRQKTALPIY